MSNTPRLDRAKEAAEKMSSDDDEYYRALAGLLTGICAEFEAGRDAIIEECAAIVERECLEDGEPEQLRNLLAAIRALRSHGDKSE